MKKQLLLGMVLTAVMVAQQSYAGPVRTVEAFRAELGKAKNVKVSELDVNKGVETAQHRNKLAELLSGILKGSMALSISGVIKRKPVELKGKVAGVEQVIKVDLAEVAKDIAHADQVLKSTNKNDLDAAGKLHFETMEKAVESGTKMLAMAEKTSDMRDIDSRGDLTAAQKDILKQETAAFMQEISLISQALKMDTAELQTFVELWNKVAAKRGPNVLGDQAYAAVMKEGRNDKAYREKLEEILGCVR